MLPSDSLHLFVIHICNNNKNDRSVSKYSCCENLLLQVTDFHRYKIISICSILEFLFCKEVCYEQNAQDEVAVSYICNHW